MTYYQVEFRTDTVSRREPKRFRTPEQAIKHAKKVLGIADNGGLESQATIVPVSKGRLPLP
jgi:hypothetical protein